MTAQTLCLIGGGIVVYFIMNKMNQPDVQPTSNDDSGNRKLPGNVVVVPTPPTTPSNETKITWH